MILIGRVGRIGRIGRVGRVERRNEAALASTSRRDENEEEVDDESARLTTSARLKIDNDVGNEGGIPFDRAWLKRNGKCLKYEKKKKKTNK